PPAILPRPPLRPPRRQRRERRAPERDRAPHRRADAPQGTRRRAARGGAGAGAPAPRARARHARRGPAVSDRPPPPGTGGLLFVGAGIFLYVGLAVASLRTQSATFDEGTHLPSGYTYLALRDHRLNPEQPPLVKLLAAAPLLPLAPVFKTDDFAWSEARQWELGRRFLYHWNDAHRLLFRGRAAVVVLG